MVNFNDPNGFDRLGSFSEFSKKMGYYFNDFYSEIQRAGVNAPILFMLDLREKEARKILLEFCKLCDKTPPKDVNVEHAIEISYCCYFTKDSLSQIFSDKRELEVVQRRIAFAEEQNWITVIIRSKGAFCFNHFEKVA